MTNFIVAFCVLSTTVVLVCSGHCQPHPPAPPSPPRHPLRFQRMAPRHGPPPLQHHNRPVRQYPPHPNMIPGGGKPHRGRPRLNIPFIHGLRPGPPRHHHPHHHHHQHHHHQQGHQGHQGHQSHQGHHQLVPQYHPQVQQRPQQQNRPQQYLPQGPFGYPSIDSAPQHTAPASIRGHPQALPVRQLAPQHAQHGPPMQAPYGFHQDEIPFGGEMDMPTSTGAYQPINLNTSPSTQPQHTPQHTTQSYGETSSAPQAGFLGSPYKGWKPIAKPFQSQYPRQQQVQHVPEQFSTTPAGLPEFPQGPPQHFPQLNDNHLPSFPIHDFPSGPSGPPSGAPQMMGGGHQQHPHQHHHDSILDQFMNEPQPQGHQFARPQHHIQRVPQQHHQIPDYPQHPYPHDAPHQQFSNGRHPHAEFSLPPQSSTTPRDVFPQFLPSGPGGSSAGDDYNLNTNTLFRENAMQIRSPSQLGHHGMEHHPQGNNNEVVVPLPPGLGDGVRLPASLFTENNFEASQSEENLVVKKPKFSLKQKLNQQAAQGGPQGPQGGGVQGGSSDETIENQLQVLPKFKQRPKFQKEKEEEEQKRDEEGGNVKNKLNGGRGRVRIRTRLRRPNPFGSNSDEDNRGDAPEKSVFPPFPGVKSEAPRRPIFRKQPPTPPQDNNNLSNENNSGENGPPGPPGPPPPALGGPPTNGPKGPISEELSNFPTLPFPSPDPDFIRDFPGPHSPVPPPPSPPPPPVRERDSPRLSNRHRQPPPPPQQSSTESERGGLAHTPGIRDNLGESGPSPRPSGGRRRRPRPKQPPREDIDHQDAQKDDGPQGPPPKPPQLDNNQQVFNDEFFFPPGFSQDPTKTNGGDQPVSFISMPNGKPQVIHHVPQPHNPQQQQQHQHNRHQHNQHHAQHPQSQEEGNHFPVHRGNLFQGNTQHFPPLEEFGGGPQNFGRPPPPPPQRQHHGHHNGGNHGGHSGYNHQLSAFSDNLPFAHRPPPRRKPPVHLPPPPQPTYAYPTTNPYASPPTGPNYLPPSAPPMLDNAPQTSNSYEVHPSGPAPAGPVYQPGPVPHQAPPPPRPSHAPPRQRIPAGGRIPNGGRMPPRHHDVMVIPQSSEFEQIPAQYIEPTQAAPATTAAPGDKPHEYHSPDIHPPGTFFDEFFKPFDTPAGTPSPDQQDEQQSNSNVNSVKVLPSNSSSSNPGTWSKSKDPTKEPSTKKPSRIPPKNLKAKIADIARKNFQSHLATADPDPTVITTYKPSITEVNTTSIPIASLSKENVPDPDETADRNTPKRFSSKTDSGPMLIHRRPQGETSSSHDGTTILFKSKRQFKKKKPIVKDEASPRSHELSTTTRSALRAAHKSIEPSDESTPRVGVLRRRKLFPRRRAFPLKKDLESATPSPASGEESVTYGESQWFRVKAEGKADESKTRVSVSTSSSSSSVSTTPPAKKSSKFTMSRLSMQ